MQTSRFFVAATVALLASSNAAYSLMGTKQTREMQEWATKCGILAQKITDVSGDFVYPEQIFVFAELNDATDRELDLIHDAWKRGLEHQQQNPQIANTGAQSLHREYIDRCELFYGYPDDFYGEIPKLKEEQTQKEGE